MLNFVKVLAENMILKVPLNSLKESRNKLDKSNKISIDQHQTPHFSYSNMNFKVSDS